MHLVFETFDGRGHNYKDVVDKDTGEIVGYVKSNGVGMYCGGGIEISLFDDRYGGYVNTMERAIGFVEGVEAAIRSATFIRKRQFVERDAA